MRMEYVIALVCIMLVSPCRSIGATASERVNTTAQIVYLAEITQSTSCDPDEGLSIQSIAHILTAEYVINSLNDTENFAINSLSRPNVSFELKVEDICLSESLTGRAIASHLPADVWHNKRQTEVSSSSLPLGFVGLRTNRNAKLAKAVLSDTDIPIITTGADDDELTRGQHNGNFFRVSMSAMQELRGMFELSKQLSAVFVTVVHTGDDGNVEFQDMVDELSRSTGVCVAELIHIDKTKRDSSYYDAIVDKIIAHEEAKVIIYYGEEKQANFLVQEYLRSSRLEVNKTLLVSSEVGNSKILQYTVSSRDNDSPLQIVTTSQYPSSGIVEAIHDYVNRSLCGMETSQQPTWLQEAGANFGDICADLSFINFDQLIHSYHAVVSLLAAYKSVQGVNTPRREFYQSMRASMMAGNSQLNFTFDVTGEVAVDDDAQTLGFSALEPQSSRKYEYMEWMTLLGNSAVQPRNKEDMEVLMQSRCTVNCNTCYKFVQDYTFIPGQSDYIVIGTGTVSDIDSYKRCSNKVTTEGMLRQMAFDFGKEYFVNETGINIGTLYIDTCYAELHTYRILDEIFGGETASLVDINGKTHEIPLNRFVLVIGDISSAVTIALQSYLRLIGIPQIAPGSTSNWLDNVDRYPHFLRTTPSDAFQTKNILQVCKEIKAESIGLIFTSSVYGNSGAQLIQKYADRHDVCIERVLRIERSETSLEEVGRILGSEDKIPRVFVFFGEERTIPKLLSMIKLHDNYWTNRGRIIVSGKTWGNSYEVIKGNHDSVYGALSFGLSTNFTYTSKGVDHFRHFLSKIQPRNMPKQHKFHRFWQDKFQCRLSDSNGVPYDNQCSDSCNLINPSDDCACDPLATNDVFTKLVVMAWSALAHTVKNALADDNSLQVLFDPSTSARQSYFQRLKGVYIPSQHNGLSDDLQLFNHTSNQGPANYQVYNIQKNSSGKAEYVEVFTFTGNTLSRNPTEQPKFYHYGVLDNGFQSPCTQKPCFCPGNIPQEEFDNSRKASDADNSDGMQRGDVTVQTATLAFAVTTFIGVVTAICIMVWSYKRIQLKLEKMVNRRQERKRRSSHSSTSDISYLHVRPDPGTRNMGFIEEGHGVKQEHGNPGNSPRLRKQDQSQDQRRADRPGTEFENYPRPQGLTSVASGDVRVSIHNTLNEGVGTVVKYSKLKQPSDAHLGPNNIAEGQGPSTSHLRRREVEPMAQQPNQGRRLPEVKEESDMELNLSDVPLESAPPIPPAQLAQPSSSSAPESPSITPEPLTSHNMLQLKEDECSNASPNRRNTYLHPNNEEDEDDHSYEMPRGQYEDA